MTNQRRAQLIQNHDLYFLYINILQLYKTSVRGSDVHTVMFKTLQRIQKLLLARSFVKKLRKVKFKNMGYEHYKPEEKISVLPVLTIENKNYFDLNPRVGRFMSFPADWFKNKKGKRK